MIILGDYNVGKTCLISRYIDGTFGKHESVSMPQSLFFIYTVFFNNGPQNLYYIH